MKRDVGVVEAIPSKRLFLSIIADYDLNKGICELVDNAIDVWIRTSKKKKVTVDIKLNIDQQIISVTDDAGGLKKEELSFIVGPGQSGSTNSDQTIGIFGVGTKRAIVALSQDIKIRTRFGKDKTYQIEFDDIWIEKQDDWDLPLYHVDDIDEGQTIVDLQRLRRKLDKRGRDDLVSHLGATYAKFLHQGDILLRVDGVKVNEEFFDDWSYPPKYGPRHYVGEVDVGGGEPVNVSVLAGLGSESSPATGEYGVYFYCNERLVARALKSSDVGFLRGYAGIPHPKISLTKIIVSLNGPPKLMPWNSSKSDIDTKHEVFVAIKDWLVSVVTDYATISRTWMGEWPQKVFKYKEGKITEIAVDDFPCANTSFLPPLPRARYTREERAEKANSKITKEKPWTKGIYEGVVASDIIFNKRNLTYRARSSLILLDSSIEIAFKEYLVNDSGKYYSDAKLLEVFRTKNNLFTEMKGYLDLTAGEWKKLAYYADIRNKLIHQRATVGIDLDEVGELRGLAALILQKLYGLDVDV